MERLTIVAADFIKTGGMDRANYALAEKALARGMRVELVAYRVASSLAGRPGVTWRPVAKPLNSYWLGEPLLNRVGRRAGKLAFAEGGRVVTNGGNCLLPAVNWVHFVHAASDFEAGAGLRGLKRRIERRQVLSNERIALRSAELVLANSERTRTDVIHHLGVPEARVRCVYLGIDSNIFQPATTEQVALVRRSLGVDGPFAIFIGALGDRRKGLEVAFEAWRSLAREPEWDIPLVVVGAGALLDSWRKRVMSAGLERHIRFLGFRQDIPRLVAAAALLVAPARYEPYGLGVAEALASHVPAIVSRCAGIAELYPDSLRGYLLDDPRSANELVSRVTRWRESQLEAVESFAPLFATVRGRTWDGMATEMLELIFP